MKRAPAQHNNGKRRLKTVSTTVQPSPPPFRARPARYAALPSSTAKTHQSLQDQRFLMQTVLLDVRMQQQVRSSDQRSCCPRPPLLLLPVQQVRLALARMQGQHAARAGYCQTIGTNRRWKLCLACRCRQRQHRACRQQQQYMQETHRDRQKSCECQGAGR
jgi:hypothetical protein